MICVWVFVMQRKKISQVLDFREMNKETKKKAHDTGGSRDDVDGLCSRASFPCPLLLAVVACC